MMVVAEICTSCFAPPYAMNLSSSWPRVVAGRRPFHACLRNAFFSWGEGSQ